MLPPIIRGFLHSVTLRNNFCDRALLSGVCKKAGRAQAWRAWVYKVIPVEMVHFCSEVENVNKHVTRSGSRSVLIPSCFSGKQENGSVLDLTHM